MARAKRRNHSHEDGEHEENGREHMQDDMEEGLQRAAGQVHRMQHRAFETFDLFSGPMARLMNQNWSMFQKVMETMQSESLKFMNRRLQHTSEALENSRDCDGISGLLAIQQEWMVEFARDYAEQTKRIAELMHELAEDGASNLSSASAEIGERGRKEAEYEHGRAAG